MKSQNIPKSKKEKKNIVPNPNVEMLISCVNIMRRVIALNVSLYCNDALKMAHKIIKIRKSIPR